jgi:hypothetical protein
MDNSKQNLPATKAQRDYLYFLTNKDYYSETLTISQAGKLIDIARKIRDHERLAKYKIHA